LHLSPEIYQRQRRPLCAAELYLLNTPSLYHSRTLESSMYQTVLITARFVRRTRTYAISKSRSFWDEIDFSLHQKIGGIAMLYKDTHLLKSVQCAFAVIFKHVALKVESCNQHNLLPEFHITIK
jgi:hypothetical protein